MILATTIPQPGRAQLVPLRIAKVVTPLIACLATLGFTLQTRILAVLVLSIATLVQIPHHAPLAVSVTTILLVVVVQLALLTVGIVKLTPVCLVSALRATF